MIVTIYFLTCLLLTAILTYYNYQIKLIIRNATIILNRESGENPYLLHEKLVENMQNNVGIVRTEELLSETLRKLRIDGDITPDDNVEMYKKNIRNHVDVIKHLSDKIGSKKVQIAEEEANNKIEKLAIALRIILASFSSLSKSSTSLEWNLYSNPLLL